MRSILTSSEQAGKRLVTMSDQKVGCILPYRLAKADLREVVLKCGVQWTLTALAEIIRETQDSVTLGQIPETLARSIEKVRDAT